MKEKTYEIKAQGNHWLLGVTDNTPITTIIEYMKIWYDVEEYEITEIKIRE